MTPKQIQSLQPLIQWSGKTMEWIVDHEEALRKLFPEEWTRIIDLNPAQIGFNLKLLDLDWRENSDFVNIMTCLTAAGFCYRNEEEVKRKNFPVLTKD